MRKIALLLATLFLFTVNVSWAQSNLDAGEANKPNWQKEPRAAWLMIIEAYGTKSKPEVEGMQTLVSILHRGGVPMNTLVSSMAESFQTPPSSEIILALMADVEPCGEDAKELMADLVEEMASTCPSSTQIHIMFIHNGGLLSGEEVVRHFIDGLDEETVDCLGSDHFRALAGEMGPIDSGN